MSHILKFYKVDALSTWEAYACGTSTWHTSKQIQYASVDNRTSGLIIPQCLDGSDHAPIEHAQTSQCEPVCSQFRKTSHGVHLCTEPLNINPDAAGGPHLSWHPDPKLTEAKSVLFSFHRAYHRTKRSSE